MANFYEEIDKLLEIEGGYVDDPMDYGGETKFGISKTSYPELDISKLLVEDAKAIYKKDYWDKLRLDDVRSQRVAGEMFDTAVNAGWSRSARFMQTAVNWMIIVSNEAKKLKAKGNEVALRDQLTLDGLVGPKTIKAINDFTNTKLNIEMVLKIVNSYQVMHYLQMADNDPNMAKFLKGWINNRTDL